MKNGGSEPIQATTVFEGDDTFTLAALGELQLLYSQKDRTLKIAAASQLLAQLGPKGLEVFGSLNLPGVQTGKGFIEIDGLRLKVKRENGNIILYAGNQPVGASVRGLRGLPGPQGEDGIGIRGPQGASIRGPIGPQGKGIAGPRGSIGPQGQSIRGESGPQGDVGDTVVGPPGKDGPQGFPGKAITGPQGKSIEGRVGPQGKSIVGPQGDDGPQGVAVRGARGLRGIGGPQGDSIVGPQGDQGEAGENGPQGETGERGESIEGKSGKRGPQGVQGRPGRDAKDAGGGVMLGGGIGPQGARGVPGVGTEGPQGVPGGAGASALDDLTDVNVPAPNDDDILSWDVVSGQWIAVPAAGGAGPQGDPGPQGNAGGTGPQGNQGNTGGTGPQGNQGNVGGTGPQGTQGSTGGTGPQGNQGTAGGTGPQGNQGTQGNTGGSGPQGNQGTQGNTGAGGPQGNQGTTGGTGPQGNQGTQGNTGGTGPQGTQGNTGGAGPQGNQGTQGNQGEPGPAEVFAERATQAVGAATTISVTDGSPITPFTTTGNITNTAVPFIAAGRNGQLVILRNDNGSGTLTLSDTNIGAGGSLLRLSASTITMAAGSSLAFEYSSIQGAWVEQYYLALVAVTPAILTFLLDGQSSALTHEWGDGSTTNDTMPTGFVATYTGVPSAANAWLDGAPAFAFGAPYTTSAGGNYYRSSTRNGTRLFVLHATVNGSALTSGTITVTYQAANYCGISTQDTTLTAAQINALANVILDTDQYYATGFAVNAGANDYVWFAFPDSAAPYFIIASERAGFTIKQNPFSHTTTYLKVANYYTYRSNIKALGAVTVVTASSDGQVRNYYGISTQDTTLTSAQVVALAQSQLDTDAYYAWSSIASAANEYLWLAYPSSYTDPYFKETSTGERAGFTVKQTALAVTNQYGYILAGGYDTARSDIIDMPTAAYTSTSTRPTTKRYVGKVGQATQLSEAQIEALQLSDLTESPNGTFASITGLGAGDYLWFCVSNANIAAPTHYGISPDAGATGYQEAAFTAMTVTAVTNAYGYTENYKDIHSDVAGLQAVNINNHTTSTWSLKTQAAAFPNRIYMGPHADSAITSAHILVLDDDANGVSNLQTTVPGSYVVTIGSGKYLWFCHPASISDLASIKDHATGFAVAGSYQANVSQANDFGITETYRCWRSDYTNIFPAGGTVDVT